MRTYLVFNPATGDVLHDTPFDDRLDAELHGESYPMETAVLCVHSEPKQYDCEYYCPKCYHRWELQGLADRHPLGCEKCGRVVHPFYCEEV